MTDGCLRGIRYYKNIHHVLPIFAETSDELASALNSIPADLRSTLTSALTIAVQGATIPAKEEDIKKVADSYLALPKTGRASFTSSNGLMRLQVLLFLTIAAQYAGPARSRSGEWLGSAVALANSLQLSKRKQIDGASRSELNSLFRRSWLSLIILDRWHASAVCGSAMIHDDDVQLEPSDHVLLGSLSYHILRQYIPSCHRTHRTDLL